MWSTSKAKLSCHDQLDQVRSMTKIWQDNDMIDCIDLVYIETENELLGPIWPGVVYDENQTG